MAILVSATDTKFMTKTRTSSSTLMKNEEDTQKQQWQHHHHQQQQQEEEEEAARREIPIPSLVQVRYQSTDFVALIHFNMATFGHNGDPGCDKTYWNFPITDPISTGRPTSNCDTFLWNVIHSQKKKRKGEKGGNGEQEEKEEEGDMTSTTTHTPVINITQWFDSITGLGAQIAVLTAKHGCGFLLWQTNLTIPMQNKNEHEYENDDDEPKPYYYHTTYDLLQAFVDAAKEADVGYEFYYSMMKNFYLCRSFSVINSCTDEILPGQINVMDDEYHNIVSNQIYELYTRYGELTEIWNDSKLLEFGPMISYLQPNAV